MLTVSGIIQQLFVGITSGMVLFLVASGMSIVMSGLGIVNFAQGAFFILGAYICYTLSQHIGFFGALVVAPIIVAIVAGILEAVFIRRVYKSIMLFQFLVTIGLTYVLTDTIKTIWGFHSLIVSVPSILKSSISPFGLSFPIFYLFLLGVSVLISLGLWLMFEKTRIGMLFRAIINNSQMVGHLGINVSLMMTLMFMFAAWITGIGGVLMSPIIGVDTNIALAMLFNVIIILAIGGANSLRGALVGSLVVGIANALGSMLIGGWFYAVIPVTLMILVLIFKPEGLVGIRTT